MATLRKQLPAIFVDRSCPQWIVRDLEGNFWRVPSVEDRGDNVRREEGKAEEACGIGRDDTLAFRDVVG
jgi:hypothetical protein